MSADKPKPLGTVERDEHAWMETVKFLDAWNGPTHIVAQAFETLKIDPIPVLAVELPGTGEGVYFTREMLASFIAHAQAWLATGSLEIPPAPPARPYGEHAAMPESYRPEPVVADSGADSVADSTPAPEKSAGVTNAKRPVLPPT